MQPQKHPGHPSSERYLFELLISIEVLVSFTLFGYIHIPPISVTTAFLPILVAGCLLTPLHAAFLGLVFGLGSLFKASAGYVQGFDALFSPFRSGAPVQSALLSVGSRVLFGLVIGLLFAAARKTRRPRFWIGVTAAMGSTIHAFFVYGALALFFPEQGIGISGGINVSDLFLSVFSVLLLEAVWLIWNSRPVQNFRSCIDRSSDNPLMERHLTWLLLLFGLFVMLLTILSAVYFSQRAIYMLDWYGITVSSGIANDTLHLQMQFLFASLALNYMSVLTMLVVYRYMSYQKYLGELDALTNVSGRRMFLANCDQLQTGWFLFLDVDDFKFINDTYGHSTGDAVLRDIAASLKKTFSGCGTVGRMGGDEFSVLIQQPLPQEVLAQKLDTFLDDISGLLGEKARVSCSIGACRIDQPQSIEVLLKQADHLLYKVKRGGKGRYLICSFSDIADSDQ